MSLSAVQRPRATVRAVRDPAAQKPRPGARRREAGALCTGAIIGVAAAVVGIGNHRIAAFEIWQLLTIGALGIAMLVKLGRPGRIGLIAVDLWFAGYLYLRVALEVLNSIVLGHPMLLTATVSPVFVLAGYAAARLVVHDQRSLRRFLLGVAFFAIPSVLIGLAQLAGIGAVNSWVIRATGSTALIGREQRHALTRASGLIGQWTDFGSYLCAIIALALIVILCDRRVRRRSRLASGIVGASFVGVIGTLTFAVIGAALAITMLSVRRAAIRLRSVVVVALMLGALAPLLVPFVESRVQQEYVATSQTLSRSSGIVPETLAFRFQIWVHQTWPAVVQRPLTGYGQGVYVQLRTWTHGPTSIVWPYPESQFFEELMTGGVIELAGLLLLLAAAYRALGRVPDGAAAPLRILIVAMLLVGITVPAFTDVGLPLPMWAGIGAMLSLSRPPRRRRSRADHLLPGAGAPMLGRRRGASRAPVVATPRPATPSRLSRIGGAGAFGAIRIVHLSLLVVLSVTLAHLLPLHQYGLYTRGSFFSNVYATVMLVGQDQLVMQRRLPIRGVRWRGLVILVIVTLLTLPIAAVTLSGQALTVVAVSSASSAGMVVVYGELSRLMAIGWHLRRGVILLLNAVSIQAAGVAAALLGGDALLATAAGAAVSFGWVAGLLLAGTRIPDPARETAPFRDGIWMGMSAMLYGSIPTLAGIIVAVRATDATAAETRFVLLAFSSVVAICSAINSEYFRAHLFAARGGNLAAQARRDMIRANLAVGGALIVGLPVGALVLSVALGPRYAGAAPAVAGLVAVVPFLLSSQVQTNIEIVAGRTWMPLARNAPAAVAVTGLVLALPASTAGVDIALIASEAIGLLCFVAVRMTVRRRGRPYYCIV